MRKLVLVSCLFACSLTAFVNNNTIKAQISQSVDSLSLTLDGADSRFINHNLSILAQRYNIDVQKAQVIQAKLYPNPNLSVNQMAYNQKSKSVFPFNKNGEFTTAISQMIILAGKRNKSVKLAQANVTLSEVQFVDLIRTLKYTLHSDFYNLYYLQKSSKVYGEEIQSLKNVVEAFSTQVAKGNISQKEYIRVKAQLYSLVSEYNDMINQMNDIQSEMRLLTMDSARTTFVPTVKDQDLANYKPSTYTLETLVDSAFQNRTDLKMAKVNTDINRLNLDYQKALAVPDLTASANYDQQGGYINHQIQVGVAMDLPFFSRNQGNIKAAKTAIDIAKVNQDNTQFTVQQNVYRALQKAYDMDKMYSSIDTSFISDFQKMQQQVLANYQKRNVSLLDFLDFYDSYKQNVLQMNQLLYNKVQSYEDINYYTATNFFK